MFRDIFGLSHDLNVAVLIYTKNKTFIGKGEIIIRNNKLPVLNFNEPITKEVTFDDVLYACSHNETWYTLLGCTMYSLSSIYPSMIIKSDFHTGMFKTIKISLQGISQWFDNSKHTQIGEDKITKHLNTNKFNTSITDDDLGRISVYSENHWLKEERRQGDFIITQKTTIAIDATDTPFSYKSVINYIHMIKNLLSILIGYPLHIEHCLEVVGNKKLPMYFCNFQEKSQPIENQDSCLTPPAYLFSGDRWNVIFKNAFENNKDNFINIWSRLPGLSSFSLYWEYELLACVSLIDKYTNVFSLNTDERISSRKFSKLKKQLRNTVIEYAECDDDICLNSHVIDSIRNQINQLKNTRFCSFKSSFDFTLNSMSDKFVGVLNLSSDDLNHLKKLRDKIAHGDTPLTKHKDNLNYEKTLQNKLLILLYCWAFKDLGIPEKDFILFLNNWQHPMIWSSSLDQVKLDKAIGHYTFLQLNNNDFIDAKSVELGVIILEYINTSNKYKYRKDLVEVIKPWYLGKDENRSRSIDEHLTVHVNTDNIHTLSYLGSVYIENRGQSFRTHGVCILNPPNEMIDKSRCWKYNAKERKWARPNS
ncbi:HEPN domain-containing protein [Agaribacterium sp. ZY112]|uniref:ApeA N-terminal domain 1-containing protein n=1 Tax=Agaribacterium sp. ZY112 TaxID=3233574 RepID=UPI0035260C50